jgi:hypothetical protein
MQMHDPYRQIVQHSCGIVKSGAAERLSAYLDRCSDACGLVRMHTETHGTGPNADANSKMANSLRYSRHGGMSRE